MVFIYIYLTKSLTMDAKPKMIRIFSISIFLFITVYASGQSVKSQIDYFGLITSLTEFRNDVSESYHLSRSWVFIDKKPDTPDKIKLKNFCQNGIARIDEKISTYSYLLDSSDLFSLLIVRENVNELIKKQLYTMNALNSFEAYDNPLIVFEVIPPVEDGGEFQELTDNITVELNKLIQKKSIEYIEFIERTGLRQSTTESLKTKKIRQLLDLLNVSQEIKEILTISNKSGLSKNYLEKDIYNILLQKYDKYYTINEIEDLISFYKTKTGKRMVKVSKKMMIETLTEIMESLK